MDTSEPTPAPDETTGFLRDASTGDAAAPRPRSGPEFVACAAAASAALAARLAAGVDPTTALEIYFRDMERCRRLLPGTAVLPGDPGGGVDWPERPPGWWPPGVPWPPPVAYGGGGHEVPPRPTTPGRCHVTVTLLRVTHSGGNEGDDWRVETCVQGRVFKFRQRQIAPLATSAYGQVVFDGDVGNCGGQVTLDLGGTATEVDTPDPNERGSLFRQETIACGEQKLVSLPVPVETAVMTFVFSIESRCVF